MATENRRAPSGRERAPARNAEGEGEGGHKEHAWPVPPGAGHGGAMVERGVRARVEIAVHLPGARPCKLGSRGGGGRGRYTAAVCRAGAGVEVRGAARTCHVNGLRKEPPACASGVV